MSQIVAGANTMRDLATAAGNQGKPDLEMKIFLIRHYS